jgi:hypothetical protein
VLLYRQTQTVRRGQGNPLFGEQQVMDEQDGERRCQLSSLVCFHVTRHW